MDTVKIAKKHGGEAITKLYHVLTGYTIRLGIHCFWFKTEEQVQAFCRETGGKFYYSQAAGEFADVAAL